jgi:hypothetical protein
MTIDYRSGVSIGELCVYVPSFFVGIYLATRQGFGRNSGWLYLILFCLARTIGPALQLAAISWPKNAKLYEGYAILNSVAISPLELVILGTLSRLVDNIHKTYNTFLRTWVLQFIQVLVIVGLILGIIGGVDAGNSFEQPNTSGEHVFHPGSLNEAGSILLIVCYVAIIALTAIISVFMSHLEAGEKRLLLAVVLALPFLLVRIVYTGLSTFSYNPKFNILDGDVTIFLCVALTMEFIIVIIFEATGLTLPRQVNEQPVEVARQTDSSNRSEPIQPKKRSVGEIALSIAKKTIIGHIVMALLGSRGEGDVEMQQPQRK